MNPNDKKLTVCMIARDEEDNLSRALESVREVADEILLVDTGSTDGTRGIAESFGATVIDHEWKDDFAEARNAALEKASGEYILFLDADEWVTAESAPKILSAISKGADAYFVRIESDVRSGAGRTYVNRLQRLFRNHIGIVYEGAVHEQIDSSLKRIGAGVENSDIVFKHSGYGLDPEDLKAKLERNLDILRRVLADEPDDAVSLFHLGETLALLESYDAAVDAYERALDTGRLPGEMEPIALQNLASSMIKVRKYEDAIRLLRRVQELDPGLLSAYLLLGSALFGLKRYEGAEREVLTYISRAKEVRKTTGPIMGFEADIPAAMVLIAKCRLATGDLEKAKEVLKDAVAMDGDLADAHILLGKIAFEKMSFAKAVPHFESALKLLPREERLYFELARSYMAAGATDRARRTIENAIGLGIESPGLLRCLGLVKVKQEDFEGAISDYERALELEPDHNETRRMLAGLHHKLGNDTAAMEYLTICK